MADTDGERAEDPRRHRQVRIAVLTGVVAAVFLAGIGVGALVEETQLPIIQVTPNLVLLGLWDGNVTFSSSCNGGSQSSFNGYFECTVTLACIQTGPGNFAVQNASAPAASNLAVTPTLPHLLWCNSAGDYRIAGQLGYTGSVTVYLTVN